MSSIDNNSAKPVPDYCTVMGLVSQGLSQREIGKRLGCSHTTVGRIVRSGPGGSAGRGSKLEPFKELLDEQMRLGVFNTRVLFQACREAGYEGGQWLVKEYVRPFRPARVRASVPVVRYETAPGQVAQMDWGYCDFVTPRGVRKIACFAMILGFSRMRYIEFASKCELENLQAAMVRAFEFFGGVPREVLTDRMRTVVSVSSGLLVFNPRFEFFASQIGFKPRVCQARRPQTKGKVERTVRLVKDEGGFEPAGQRVVRAD